MGKTFNRIQFVLFWVGLLMLFVSFYISSDIMMWISGATAFILVIKIGVSRCENCKERNHLHMMRRGIFSKCTISFPLGHCDHCGHRYI